MKRVLFFVNPKAGQGTGNFNIMAMLKEFARKDWRVEFYLTKGPGDLTETIAREGMNYDMIIASGGDGTLNETTSGLMQLPPEVRPSVGYIPRGTVNDVSYNLGLNKTPLRAARDIVDGVPFAMDVGKFNDRWFNYVAGFGLFTDVAYRTPQEDKKVLGRLAYLLDGVKSFTDIHPVPVKMTANGQTWEENVLLGLVTSTVSIGGFRMLTQSNVDLSDGLFEVLLVRHIDSPARLRDLANALRRRDFTGDGFVFLKTDRVEFTFPEAVDWTLDGEFGGSVDHAAVENCPSAVCIQIPAQTKKKRPVDPGRIKLEEEIL